MKNINYLADKYGRGYVGVTTRLQLEIPWIKDTDVESFMEEAKKIRFKTWWYRKKGETFSFL